MVQLSHSYMTTGGAIPLAVKTFISKVIFLLLFIYFFLILFITLKKKSHAPHPEPSSLPTSPYHPPGPSQRTSPQHPASCTEPGLASLFIHDISHVKLPNSFPEWLHHLLYVTSSCVGEIQFVYIFVNTWFCLFCCNHFSGCEVYFVFMDVIYVLWI